MSDASSRNKRSPPLPVGRIPTELSARVQAGDVSSSVDPPADQGNPKKKCRKSKLLRAMAHNSAKELDCFLECPFANTMDLTEIFEFWQNLSTTEICRALWALLMVLFEIVHEWRLKETHAGKYTGMGMNPRRAILWHVTEFMDDAHTSRIRTSLRRKLSSTALQSVHSSMDSQQALLQDKADEERQIRAKETIQAFLQKTVVPKIRLKEWSKPVPLPEPNHLEIDWKWPHWTEFHNIAEQFWNETGWHIEAKKKPFLGMANKVFWDMVLTQDLKPYHGSVTQAMAGSLDQGEGIRDGNDTEQTAAAARVSKECKESDEREQNQKRVAEALSATDLLSKMSWLHECPDTEQHRHCFVAMMDFCREHIRDPALQSVQAFMQKPEFPSSLRAWSIMPWAALKELEKRGQLPRFLTAPTDAKIRLHANLAPEFYADPGNVNLDVTFYLLCLWEFMTPISLVDILKLSWKEYGSRGEKSSQGPMNFRGNVLEALMGYCHERSIKVSGGYHAGRQKKPEQASSSSGKSENPVARSDNATLRMSNQRHCSK